MINASMPATGRIEAAMTKAVSATFETMVFSEPSIQVEAKVMDSPTLGVSLQVSSPYAMMVAAVLPQGLARQIAAIIFRHEGNGDTPEVVRDAVGEVMNTMVGLFMQYLIPADQLFTMGFPEAWSGEAMRAAGSFQCYAFEVEGYPMQVFVFPNMSEVGAVLDPD